MYFRVLFCFVLRTWYNKFVLIELFVDGGGDEANFGVGELHRTDPFRTRNDVKEDDLGLYCTRI